MDAQGQINELRARFYRSGAAWCPTDLVYYDLAKAAFPGVPLLFWDMKSYSRKPLTWLASSLRRHCSSGILKSKFSWWETATYGANGPRPLLPLPRRGATISSATGSCSCPTKTAPCDFAGPCGFASSPVTSKTTL